MKQKHSHSSPCVFRGKTLQEEWFGFGKKMSSEHPKRNFYCFMGRDKREIFARVQSRLMYCHHIAMGILLFCGIGVNLFNNWLSIQCCCQYIKTHAYQKVSIKLNTHSCTAGGHSIIELYDTHTYIFDTLPCFFPLDLLRFTCCSRQYRSYV